MKVEFNRKFREPQSQYESMEYSNLPFPCRQWTDDPLAVLSYPRRYPSRAVPPFPQHTGQ